MKKILAIFLTALLAFTACVNNDEKVEQTGEITNQPSEFETINSTPQSTQIEYNTAPIISYEKSEFTLDNPKFQKLIYQKALELDVSFLSEDLQQQFLDARFLAYAFQSFPMELLFCTNIDLGDKKRTVLDVPNENCSNGYASFEVSDISYDSFIENINKVFTKDYLDKTLNSDYYFDYNGYLTITIGEGANILGFQGIEFELVEESEDKIEFIGTATYNEDNSPSSPVREIKEFEFTLLNTDNGWRFDSFPIWN